MISKASSALRQPPPEAYVWVWLPGAVTPVVAGLLSERGGLLYFNYGRSYLARADAMALYAPELALQAGEIPLVPGMRMPSCIRDASPDAWGRRVLLNHSLARSAQAAGSAELSELSYLLESGSNRIGALDFQASPTHYVPRQAEQASLDELLQATEHVQRGLPLPAALDAALLHGSSIGGARPKAMLHDGHQSYIAKFSASQDIYSVVKAEFVAMRLARAAGLHVAQVHLRSALGKDVLLIERFDRVWDSSQAAWQRRAMVSALTLLELDEMMAAYASYEHLAEMVRHRFSDAKATLRELFSRIVFNILCGNTDDHARNHAAFWNGRDLSLTPAYDICPQARVGQTASQAMLIHGKERGAQLATCIAGAAVYLLSQQEAIDIVNQQVAVIERDWHRVCEEAQLGEVDKAYFWHRQFLNPFAFQGVPEGVRVPEALRSSVAH
jgi:serine/threonine-protein kinase HipA